MDQSINQRQPQLIEYLVEENRVLREQIGNRRMRSLTTSVVGYSQQPTHFCVRVKLDDQEPIQTPVRTAGRIADHFVPQNKIVEISKLGGA